MTVESKSNRSGNRRILTIRSDAKIIRIGGGVSAADHVLFELRFVSSSLNKNDYDDDDCDDDDDVSMLYTKSRSQKQRIAKSNVNVNVNLYSALSLTNL